jgi:primosomal replication protein N''
MPVEEVVHIKLCPSCRGERPVFEAYCENIVNGVACGWPLADEPPRRGGESPLGPSPSSNLRRCTSGHELGAGDVMCVVCGADPACDPSELSRQPPITPDEETIIGGWHAVERMAAEDEPWEKFVVRRSGDEGRALLRLYRLGHEPDPRVQDALRRMSAGRIPKLLSTGDYEGRAYEVTEAIEGGTLEEAGTIAAGNTAMLRRMVECLGLVLSEFSEIGLRHRDLRPGNILLRSREPLELAVTGFKWARLSDFDLESATPPKFSRYAAPETIVGAVSAASDWWSLGMVVLEQATAGACFAEANEKAFQIHVVTRGVELAVDLDDTIRLLLRGLLARDPLERWGWQQVRSWLAGESVAAPAEVDVVESEGPAITLAGRRYTRVGAFALAAAEAGNWDEARDLVLRGAVATWLDERAADAKISAQVRRLAVDEKLSEDIRHALVLMVLNPSLPFTMKGELIGRSWLLQHPDDGHQIIAGEATRHLERMRREPWLVALRQRAEAVRERAAILEIELDEERLRLAALATSRARLDAERTTLRRIYPDTDHAGLASLIERSRLTDEDLVVLVTAAAHQFIPLAILLDRADEQARKVSVALDRGKAEEILVRPRREIFSEVDGRVANFARCEIQPVDEWADSFRVERRMPLARAAVLLAVPKEAWKEPSKQQYVANLMQIFEKRVSASVQRGPLVPRHSDYDSLDVTG